MVFALGGTRLLQGVYFILFFPLSPGADNGNPIVGNTMFAPSALRPALLLYPQNSSFRSRTQCVRLCSTFAASLHATLHLSMYVWAGRRNARKHRLMKSTPHQGRHSAVVVFSQAKAGRDTARATSTSRSRLRMSIWDRGSVFYFVTTIEHRYNTSLCRVWCGIHG